MLETGTVTPEVVRTTTAAPMRADDVRAIAEDRIEQMERAWNQADGAGFAQVFAADTDFVDIRGGHHEGVEAVARGHQALFDSIYAGSTVRFELETAREVAPGCMVAVANSTLTCPTGPLQGVNRARFTMTVAKRQGAWSVAAFHNTLVRQDA